MRWGVGPWGGGVGVEDAKTERDRSQGERNTE